MPLKTVLPKLPEIAMRQHINIIKHPAASSEVLTAFLQSAGFQPALAPKGRELNPQRLNWKKTKENDKSVARTSFGVIDRSGHRLDGSGQATLVARSLILVDDSLISDRIDGTDGCLKRSLCSGFVGRSYSLSHVLDRGAQLGAQTGVVVTLFDSLPCTFSRLRTIGHKNSSIDCC
jgi:hypothetical protein